MKNMIRAGMVFLLSAVLSGCGAAGAQNGTGTVSTISGAAASEAAITEDGWRSAYESYLNERYKKGNNPDDLYYFIKNIDGAGSPELFVIDHAEEDGDQMKVYTYRDEVRKIGSYFLTGTTRLLYSDDPSCPGVFTFGVGGGLEHYGYMTVQDGKLSATELWNEDYSGISKELGKDRDRILELSSDKLLIRESGKAYKNDQDIDTYKMTLENPISEKMEKRPNACKNISILHAAQKILKKHKLKEINVAQDDEYTQINNNQVNGNFLTPYKGGYFYEAEIEGTDDSEVIYQNEKGSVKKQKDFPNILYLHVDGDFIYFYDDEKNELRRIREKEQETVIHFQYSQWNPLFFAEDAIYYTDIAQSNKTYIYKVNYDGTQRKELYVMDAELEQIYKYKDDLWFVYTDRDMESGLGKIGLTDDSIQLYKEIHPEGNSFAGDRLSFNNGYVYFNADDRFQRIHIHKDYVEQVFTNDAFAVNFAGNSLFFCHDRSLYRMDSDGVKEIKTLKGSTDGFNGIRVEDDKIYIGTYSGAFYSRISQIDTNGRTIKDIVK